jgi:hypothetical protein
VKQESIYQLREVSLFNNYYQQQCPAPLAPASRSRSSSLNRILRRTRIRVGAGNRNQFLAQDRH